MTPTPAQQKLIDQTLRTVLKFKDTYDEAYDHILSSLDALPDDRPFTDVLHSIIENELGGTNGLKTMERKQVLLAIREYIKEYFGCAFKPLTSWMVLLLIVFTSSFYFLTNSGFLNKVSLTFVFGFVPLGFMAATLQYYLRKKKLFNPPLGVYLGPIRQNILAFSGFMLFFPLMLWETTNLICYHFKREEVPDSIATIVFLAVCLHTFAYCKMHLDKRNFTQPTT